MLKFHFSVNVNVVAERGILGLFCRMGDIRMDGKFAKAEKAKMMLSRELLVTGNKHNGL